MHVPELARGKDGLPHVGAGPAVIGEHLIARRPIPLERGGDGRAHQRPELKQAGPLARRRRVMRVHLVACQRRQVGEERHQRVRRLAEITQRIGNAVLLLIDHEGDIPQVVARDLADIFIGSE